jgi:hypothetical protein
LEQPRSQKYRYFSMRSPDFSFLFSTSKNTEG